MVCKARIHTPSHAGHDKPLLTSNVTFAMDKTKAKPADQKKSRTIYALDNPFCQIQWPTIACKEDQELILELLCTLLVPIGDHRRLYVDPSTSRGKRSKRQRKARKRQRMEDAASNDNQMDADEKEASTESKVELAIGPTATSSANHWNLHPPPPPPPLPEISSHVTVGLNSITTQLSKLAATYLPSNLPLHVQLKQKKQMKRRRNQTSTSTDIITAAPPQFTAIFVTRADSQPTPLHSHLPILSYITSSTSLVPTLLVPLPRGSAAKLQTALAIPSVNFIGLLSTLPETGTAGALLQLVRKVVKPVAVPWLEGKIPGAIPSASLGEYIPLKIKKLLTTVGPPKPKARGTKNPNTEEGKK